jgi:N6-adenosine-specific RNA methylase IME4
MTNNKKYNIIYADPPWYYHTWNTDTFSNRKNPKNHGRVRMASAFYQTLKTEDICKLPIREMADKNCALIMWVTNPLLPDGLEVMQAWGFKYKTVIFCWVKLTPNSSRLKLGLGYYTRPNMEIALLGMRGSLPRLSRSINQVHKANIKAHSEKPHLFRDLIVKLFGDIPRIELFARHIIPGWDSYGNEIGRLEKAQTHIDFIET